MLAAPRLFHVCGRRPGCSCVHAPPTHRHACIPFLNVSGMQYWQRLKAEIEESGGDVADAAPAVQKPAAPAAPVRSITFTLPPPAPERSKAQEKVRPFFKTNAHVAPQVQSRTALV